ncbi:MAG: hypothetical protein WA624_22030 [Methylocella sp.]
MACGRGKKEGIFGLPGPAPAIHTAKKFWKKWAGQVGVLGNQTGTIRRRDHGEEALAEVGRGYNVTGWAISRLMNE